MTTSDERGCDAPAVPPAGDAEFRDWADRQPIRFGVVGGRRVRLAEEQQGTARLAMARAIAVRVLGGAEAADAWMAPAPELGGRLPGAWSPATKNGAGSRCSPSSAGIDRGRSGTAMDDIVAGEKVGAFVMLVDEDGLRHAVRCHAVLALSDAEGAGSDTVLQLTGNGSVTIRRPLSEVLTSFS